MKNVCLSLILGLTLFATIVHAQYADDSVTIHDNRKAKDPFKASKQTGKSNTEVYTTISLTDYDPEKKVPEGMSISDIQVISAVGDSTLLGYIQAGTFGRWKKAVPDKPYTAYLQSYIDRRYGPMYIKDAVQLVWVIQELRIGERTFGMSEKGFLRLKAVAFIGNGNGTFKWLTKLDTILIKGNIDIAHTHQENISDALHILLEQSLTKDVLLQKTDSPLNTLSAIREKALQRYQRPALQSREHADGIYLTFEEFINDQPSIKNVAYSLEHNTVRFFYTDSNGKETFIDKLWGVRKNGLLLKQYYNLLIPIEQRQNSIVVKDYLSLVRSKSSANLSYLPLVIGGGVIGGAIAGGVIGAATGGPSVTGVLPTVDNIPYIGNKTPFATGVDIETGEFTL